MPTTEKPSKREIHYSSEFRRDFKREKKGRHKRKVQKDLDALVNKLANDNKLPKAYMDHPLSGQWKHHRDCHLYPDLVLIYRKIDAKRNTVQLLRLNRLGSHSDLFKR